MPRVRVNLPIDFEVTDEAKAAGEAAVDAVSKAMDPRVRAAGHAVLDAVKKMHAALKRRPIR